MGYDMFLEMLPKIDLHGFDRESARVLVNDFVEEASQMGYSEILIIHGIGSGIVKKSFILSYLWRKCWMYDC